MGELLALFGEDAWSAGAGGAPPAAPSPPITPVSTAGLEPDAVPAALLETIRRTFGIGELRPMQGRAIRAALDGRDALIVLPTGGGKSLCYQAPALAREGLTLVISPLISLMKDQLDGLRACGVPAAMLTSAQSPPELRAVHEAVRAGTVKLLLLAPERLMLPGFLDDLRRAGLATIAIDEAHCISHWGHDFRPEYRQLGELRQRLPGVPIQAFTATATPAVRADIVAALRLADPEVLVGDFDRPNLTYRVRPRHELGAQVLAVVRAHGGEAGIVYCQSRRETERLARELAGAGVRCAPYHAGLDADVRRTTQERFQNEELDVVVATVAFGMGIDRPDVRFVVHANLPKGVEQYCQESGRAGRDGLPSECVLFYSGADFHNWRTLIERSATEARERGVETAGLDVEAALERLGHVWGYATGAVCRHRTLVEYFGQPYRPAAPEAASAEPLAAEPGPPAEPSCGACDVCLGELAAVPESTVVAQKILSCVVRCGQRYGAAHVTDVLRGAANQRVRRAGHDALPTWGLLKEHSARDVRNWVEQLVALGLLATTPGDYPTLYLLEDARAVLSGERAITLFRPVAAPVRSTRRGGVPAVDGLEPDPGLFEDLRRLRRELARERGVPPYVIFNDRTLAQMAALVPRTDAELRAVKGVGDKKAVDLGPAFLARIAAWRERAAGGDAPPAS